MNNDSNSGRDETQSHGASLDRGDPRSSSPTDGRARVRILLYLAFAAGMLSLFACGAVLPITMGWSDWGRFVRTCWLLGGFLLALPSLVLGVKALIWAGRIGMRRTLAIQGISMSGLALAFAVLWSVLAYPDYVAEGPWRRQLACVFHAKELARATFMYMEDHDGLMPPANKWSNALLPYLKDRRLFACPAAPDLRSGYAFNRALSSKPVKGIRHPERTVLLFESNLGWNGAGGPRSLCRPARHRSGNVIAFADGYVKTVDAKEQSQLVWEP